MQKFIMEFILHAHLSSQAAIKSSLSEFADKVEIGEPLDLSGASSDFKVNVVTDDPTLIFDACSQFGRIKSAKINEAQVS
ncbi:MAG: hypothetical protein ABSE81_03895 [Candidatus Omnitrophota bacterium]|jgi:dihydroxyacetone kinase-like predicted kinase